MTYDDNRKPGSKAIYSCIDGFELVGSKTRICGSNIEGVWSDQVPKCQRKHFVIHASSFQIDTAN